LEDKRMTRFGCRHTIRGNHGSKWAVCGKNQLLKLQQTPMMRGRWTGCKQTSAAALHSFDGDR